MKLCSALREHTLPVLSVPSTRAYAMKQDGVGDIFLTDDAFSTLNSGLRDETRRGGGTGPRQAAFSTLNSGLRDETKREACKRTCTRAFQYPQLGPTR